MLDDVPFEEEPFDDELVDVVVEIAPLDVLLLVLLLVDEDVLEEVLDDVLVELDVLTPLDVELVEVLLIPPWTWCC